MKGIAAQQTQLMSSMSGISLDAETKQRDVNAFEAADLRLYTLSENAIRKLVYLTEAGCDESRLDVYLQEQLPYLQANSDLIAGRYEGGFKVWESTVDLIEHLEQERLLRPEQSYLDVGCGAGLLGIGALQCRPRRVHFMDFNRSVLRWFTAPNVLLNCRHLFDRPEQLVDYLGDACRFLPGDWDEQPEPAAAEDKYDCILTAETIYSPENYEKLVRLIRRQLAPSGKAFVAAKTHYFGVGGSVYDFERLVQADAELKVRCVRTVDAPVERQILQIEWK